MRIALSVFLVVLTCAQVAAAQHARRARPNTAVTPPDSLRATHSGVIVKIESMIDRDGPLFIYLDTGEKEPVKLVFGSLFTSPRPDKDRLALYEKLRRFTVGDSIRADGYRFPEGFLIESVSRPGKDNQERGQRSRQE